MGEGSKIISIDRRDLYFCFQHKNRLDDFSPFACGYCKQNMLSKRYIRVIEGLKKKKLLDKDFKYMCCHCYLVLEYEKKITCCGRILKGDVYASIDETTYEPIRKIYVKCKHCNYENTHIIKVK